MSMVMARTSFALDVFVPAIPRAPQTRRPVGATLLELGLDLDKAAQGSAVPLAAVAA